MARQRIEPVLNIPSGLRLNNIYSFESIPDKYIRENFPLDEYRTKYVKYETEAYPLIGNLIKHLSGNASVVRINTGEDDGYDDEDDLIHHIWNKKVDIKNLKQALKEIIESPILDLFDVAELYCLNANRSERDTSEKEILLRKKKVGYESNESVIVKIKKKVFNEIQRYRRVKKGL